MLKAIQNKRIRINELYRALEQQEKDLLPVFYHQCIYDSLVREINEYDDMKKTLKNYQKY
jgi:hypothetical protein